MHVKRNKRFRDHFFYTETGTYSTEYTYNTIFVLWLFKWVILDITIESGRVVDNNKIPRYCRKSWYSKKNIINNTK
jgi:hypothetical protein